MRTKSFTGKRFTFHLAFGLLLGLALLLAGCGGSDSYDTPTETNNSAINGASTNVLIDTATLKGWIADGLVNSDGSFDKKVVILDFGSYTLDPDTDPARIAGACRVKKADLEALRFEGVGDANPLAATGAQMDAVLQRLGINANTTIVFTTSSSSYYSTRAYWTFRYWGFPKDRLKLLNGGNKAFGTDYPALMTSDVPLPTPSTYSVRDLAALNPDLRASVGEIITIIKDDLPTSTTNLVIDARGATNYSGLGSTPGLVGGDVVVVDGHPEGGQYLSQGDLFNADKITFKTKEEIEALFTAKGWSMDKKTTVYCTSGYSATPLFFALDAILGADAQLFDGSWSQLGKYSSYATAGGQLPAGSPWSIDKYLVAGALRYNNDIPAPLTIETLQLDATAEANAPFLGDNPADDSDVNPAANQIETQDLADVGAGAPLAFPAPVETATSGVLIDATTLQGWMDADLVNAPLGSERVVILDATSATAYAAGHLPGAVLWDISQHVMTRTEGPAPAVNMVVTAERMNTLIQAAGIDENTTIVITTSQAATYFPSRAYVLFRYYGFPKDHIKVLNGYNGSWIPAELTTTVPTVTASTLSVQDIANLQPDLRVALPELMDGLRDGRGIPVDFRGVKTAAGSTAGVFGDVSGDYVVFEGQLKGGKGFVWSDFNVDYANGDLRFKSAPEIAAALNAIGVDGSETVYSYCRTGYIASAGFFVLDAILDWPVMVYDGSWSQFGKMSTTDTGKGGELPSGSLWATDNMTYMDVITYNADNLKKVEPLNPDSSALSLDPSDSEANQVENADEEYQTTPSSTDSDSTTAPSAGDGAVIGC